MNKKIHTPEGVCDIYKKDFEIEEEILNRVLEIFKSYSYDGIKSPTFEYIEVFSDEQMGSTNPKDMYKFFDREGSALALRSDMTPPIARIVATSKSFPKNDSPLRLSYSGNAFKYNAKYQGRLREFNQAGIELFNVNSVEADGEVVSVAINSILSLGISNFKIYIGEASFFKAILEESALPKDVCDDLENAITKRDYVSLEKIVKQNEMEDNIKELFLELPKLVGTLEILAYAKRLTRNSVAKRALTRLQDLYQILKFYNLQEYIIFDLSMTNNLNYYTGIIFRGYTYKTGYSILSGGRYDNLMEQFGVTMPAVGFCIKITEILSVIKKQNIKLEIETERALIAYNKDAIASAINVANVYRNDGKEIELSFIGEDLEKNISYAKDNNLTHVLFFESNETVKVVSLKDEMGGFTVDIPVSELMTGE